MRHLVVTVGTLVIVAACGRVPGGQVTPGDYKLYEAASTASSNSLSVIDSRSHSVELKMPLGTPSSDWMHLYTLNGAMLFDLDPQSGATLHTLRLPGYFELPPATISGVPGGLSQNGRWLVLESFDTNSTDVTSATHLLVVDTSYAKPPQQIVLSGLFNFDTISNDGLRVYLIQYLSSTSYYVRFYDLAAGRLDPTIIFDKSDGSAAMAGLRLSGVASPDGNWLYSVYVRQDQSAFIHALSLDGSPIAFCIDLPGAGYSTDPNAFHWSLALGGDGSRLYAGNGAMGIVAEVIVGGNAPPVIARTAHVANGQSGSALVQNVEAKEFGGNASAVSPDGHTLVIGGKTGLIWIDTTSLKAKDSQLAGWTVWSLAMSPDGAAVYAVNDGGMIAEVPMIGSHTPNIFGGAAGQPLALIRVAAAAAP